MDDRPAVLSALLATIFTWGMTALGAAGVFFFREFNRRVMDAMLGFAAGVMIAASFWSLLSPALELAASGPLPAWLPALLGFAGGGAFLGAVDRLVPHLHLNFPRSEAEGPASSWRRSMLLTAAITIHNIPEGLAVGVAFGAAVSGLPGAAWASALALAIGIGIQNLPEGLAISLPLRREGFSRAKAFAVGQLSAVVEPVAAVLGALAVVSARSLLPYALSFAAGAMIFVVVEELIPESQRGGNTDLATAGALLGFAVMMVLDVALG